MTFNHKSNLIGIITDGDVRRMVVCNRPIGERTVDDVMTTNPRAVRPDAHTYDALNMMEQHQITVLPITDTAGRVRGIQHLHDILGKDEFKFNGV